MRIGLLSMSLPAAIMRCLKAPRFTGLAAGTALVGLWIAGIELAGRHAVTSPSSMTRAQIVKAPRVDLGVSAAPESARIRALVQPNERILAVPYDPDVYLAADRKPMDRYFYGG
jgi:hypothetical protein